MLRHLHAFHDDDSVAVTVSSVEEQIRGRLEIIRRHGGSSMQVAAYAAFQETRRYFASWQVVDFTQAAFEQFSILQQQRVRIGSQDLRIAAITLTSDALLVTRNTRDFAQVPNLRIEDWSA